MKPPDLKMARRYELFLARRKLPHNAISVVAFFFSWDA